MRWLVVLLLSGCDLGDANIGAIVPFVEQVYTCTLTTGDELELCFDSGPRDLAASLTRELGVEATCKPTDRHTGPCLYRCGGGSGCNALNGCWCPSER